MALEQPVASRIETQQSVSHQGLFPERTGVNQHITERSNFDSKSHPSSGTFTIATNIKKGVSGQPMASRGRALSTGTARTHQSRSNQNPLDNIEVERSVRKQRGCCGGTVKGVEDKENDDTWERLNPRVVPTIVYKPDIQPPVSSRSQTCC